MNFLSDPANADYPNASAHDVLVRLELEVKHKLEGQLQGNYRGLTPGHGSELGEARLYQHGDDVRRIDWNVTARLRQTHTRDTIADRELTTWVLMDQSPRLNFGTASQTKSELGLAACAGLGFINSGVGNKIGAVLARQRQQVEIVPARSSRKHLLHILNSIYKHKVSDGEGETNLALAIKKLSAVAKQRSLIVVVSDFLVADGWQQPLAALANKHELLAVQLIDPRDFELPNVGMAFLTDPASGKQLQVQTSDPKLRHRFASAAANRQKQLDSNLATCQADHMKLATNSDWARDMASFVTGRSQRLNRKTFAA